MKFSNKTCEYFAYGLLIFLAVVVVVYSFSFKYKSVQNLNFDKRVNMNSNAVEGFYNLREGYSSKPQVTNENILDFIDNKLKGITSELGGDKGRKETKQILVNTKKVCNLESAKCMMNMIDENKGPKTIDLERMLEDDTNENCIKCKKYTELSNSIQSIIDNL